MLSRFPIASDIGWLDSPLCLPDTSQTYHADRISRLSISQAGSYLPPNRLPPMTRCSAAKVSIATSRFNQHTLPHRSQKSLARWDGTEVLTLGCRSDCAASWSCTGICSVLRTSDALLFWERMKGELTWISSYTAQDKNIHILFTRARPPQNHCPGWARYLSGSLCSSWILVVVSCETPILASRGNRVGSFSLSVV